MIPLKYIFHSIIVPFSVIIPILIFIKKRKGATEESKLLFYFLIISGLINFSAILMTRNRISNLPLLHLYTIIEAIFILSYFRLIFANKAIKTALLILTVLFPILCVLNFTLLQSIYTFNTYTRPLEALIITFFCLLYLYKSGFTENWINISRNWFNMGILIYFPTGCIIFILSNYLVFVKMNKEMNTMLWNIHAVFVMLMYLSWAKGFSLLKKDG